MMHHTDGRCLDRGAAMKAGFALAFTLAVGDVSAETSFGGFDAEVLRQRGIDPRLAEYLAAAARFTPGEHKVRLQVNGRARGDVSARFDDDGALCFDMPLITAAGLQPMVEADREPACSAFIQRFPLTQVELDPNAGAVELIVSADALSEVPRDLSGFSAGGTAAILNYELFGMSNRFEQGASHTTSAKTEVGFNAGDWIVRSNQLYSASNGVSQYRHVDAYAQRTFSSLGLMLQVGQIQLVNPVLGGAQVTGLQVANEQGLSQRRGQGRVEGTAQGPARVEVRQQNNLIHTTIVPGGPFVLRDVPRVNQRTALDVTVIEADGSRQQFTVSAAEAGIETPDDGYVLGIGQLRNVQHVRQSTIMNAGWTGSLGRQSSLSAGALTSDAYTSLGTSMGRQLWAGAQVRADVVSSRSALEGVRGVQSRLSMSQQLGQGWSLNAALTQQSVGYRELLEAQYGDLDTPHYSRVRTQWNGGLGWSHQTLGSFNAGYSQSSLFDGTTNSRATASWSKSHKGATVSVTAERDLGRRGGFYEDDYRSTGTAIYASVSLPLGERKRLRTSYRDSNDRKRVSTHFSDSPSDNVSYQVGAERDLANGRDGLSTSVSLLPRFAQVDLGYSGDGSQQRSVNAGIRGGLVAHGSGVTPTAYPVGDTFAVVNVGDVGGVKIDTASGPVWTNGSGLAVVPRLHAYSRSNVEVVPRSLPRNVDLNDGARQITAGRGAVERIDFGVTVTRRVLLNATDASGAKLPAGASVVDERDFPVALVDQNSAVFLPNAVNQGRLWISSPHMPRCELQFELPQEVDTDAYYETAPAVCRAA